MIYLKTPEEIEKIRRASEIVAECLNLAETMMVPGVATAEIDRAVEAHIRSRKARPAFKGYGLKTKPFPAATCISINEEVVHGIPGPRRLEAGMIVSVDVGVQCDGYYGDGAQTFAIGEVDEEKQRLLVATRDALEQTVDRIIPNVSRLSDIWHNIQIRVEADGFSVVRDLVGHGIGRNLHEEPQIPNYGVPGCGVVLKPGMVLAIEPMINAGTYAVKTLPDGWTVVTADGKPSAHFEYTVALKEHGAERLSVIKR